MRWLDKKFQFWSYRKMKTIDNIKEYKHEYENKPKRNMVKICVIDDEGFQQVDNLKKLGYENIDVKYNFESIDALERYDVILCDLDGIGKVLDTKKQGLAVVEQILINFPLKKVFIYSGKTIEGYGSLPENVTFISKQTSTNDISKLLDNECSYLWNPIEGWEKISELLIKNSINAKTIAVIEDRFVKAVLGKDKLFDSKEMGCLPKIDDVIKAIEICVRISQIVGGFVD